MEDESIEERRFNIFIDGKSIPDLITKLNEEGKSNEDILKQLRSYSPLLSEFDIEMLIDIKNEQSIPSDKDKEWKLRNEADKESNLDSNIMRRYKDSYLADQPIEFSYYDGNKVKFLSDLFIEITDWDSLYKYALINGIDTDALSVAYFHYRKDKLAEITKNISTDKERLEELYSRYIIGKSASKAILKRLLNNQTTLLETFTNDKALDITNAHITATVNNFIVKKDGYSYKSEDFPSIFDQLGPNKYIPFIQYNDPNKKPFYKIYYGDSEKINDEPPLDVIITTTEQNYKPDVIYFSLLIEKEESERRTVDSYVRCSFALRKGKSRLKIPVKRGKFIGIDESLDRIKKVFTMLTVNKNDIDPPYIVASMDINFFYIDSPSLHHLLLNDPVFRNYLYMDEKEKAHFAKKRITYRFKNELEGVELEKSSNISFGFSRYKYYPLESTTKSYQSFTRLIIMKATNLNEVNKFITIISYLFRYYQIKRKDTIEYLSSRVPYEPTYILDLNEIIELSESEEKKISKDLKEGVPLKKLKSLSSHAPQIYISGYATKCQCKKQPIIIDEKDRKDYESIYEDGDKVPDSGDYFVEEYKGLLYVCPDTSLPYPIKVDNTLDNSSTEPYYICCSDKLPEGKKTKAIGTLKSLRILEPNKLGMLPKILVDLLKDDENRNICRYGIKRSFSSLLDCLNLSQKKKYKREELTINPELCFQEKYDIREDILDKLKDENVFLDPSRYYRALEEIYDVNIFTFTIVNEEVFFDIPRHKYCHIREFRDRNCVLIFKHKGSIKKNKNYQCELIISASQTDNTQDVRYKNGKRKMIVEGDEYSINPDGKGRKLFFDRTFNKKIYDLYHKYYNYYILSPDKIYLNKFGITWEDIIDNAFSQKIDNNGKMRALNVRLDDNNYTIIFPPSQPLNLKSEETIYSSELDIKNLEPDFKSQDGLWVGNFFIYCIYPENLDISKKDTPVVYKHSTNPAKDAGKVKKYLDIYIPIVNWIWRNSKLYVTDFFEKYVEKKDRDQFPDKDIYSVNRMEQVPIISGGSNDQKTIERIEFMSKKWPIFFGDKIYMWPELYDKMLKYLERQFQSIRYIGGEDFIYKVLNKEEDFLEYPYSKVIIGSDKLRNWIMSYKINSLKSGIIGIYDKLSFEHFFLHEPFYYFQNENIFIIQNCSKGKLKNALEISKVWNKDKINIGYDLDAKSSETVHTIFTLNLLGQIQYYSGPPSKNYVLKYEINTEKYAAILPFK